MLSSMLDRKAYRGLPNGQLTKSDMHMQVGQVEQSLSYAFRSRILTDVTVPECFLAALQFRRRYGYVREVMDWVGWRIPRQR